MRFSVKAHHLPQRDRRDPRPGGEAAALTASKQLEVIGAADMYLRSGR